MFQDKSIPLYYQLETILREQILNGIFPENEPFPTEDSLAKQYGVSRITVRKALSALEGEGLILRKRGKGTVVSFRSKEMIHYDPIRFLGSMENPDNNWRGTDTEIKEFGNTTAPKNVTDILKLPEKEILFRIVRLRFDEGCPYCYIEDFLMAEIGNKINLEELKDRQLLEVIEKDLGIGITSAIQTFEATIANPETATLLKTSVGAPLLKINRASFKANKKPAGYVSILFRADKYSFQVALSRTKKGGYRDWKIR